MHLDPACVTIGRVGGCPGPPNIFREFRPALFPHSLTEHSMNQPQKISVRGLTLVLCPLAVAAARADAPRVLPPGTLPNDKRLGPLKDLDGYFPYTPYKTPAEWAK